METHRRTCSAWTVERTTNVNICKDLLSYVEKHLNLFTERSTVSFISHIDNIRWFHGQFHVSDDVRFRVFQEATTCMCTCSPLIYWFERFVSCDFDVNSSDCLNFAYAS